VTSSIPIEELAARLKPLGWSLDAVQLGVRANFCCEYCGADLLATIESYDSWQRDHIVATAREGLDHLDNLALACKLCNFLKRHSDVVRSFNVEDRHQVIAAIGQLIHQRRAAKQHLLDESVRIIDAFGARVRGSAPNSSLERKRET
jgi:5-methylcytosine-specific restriction endonuclease McrA